MSPAINIGEEAQGYKPTPQLTEWARKPYIKVCKAQGCSGWTMCSAMDFDEILRSSLSQYSLFKPECHIKANTSKVSRPQQAEIIQVTSETSSGRARALPSQFKNYTELLHRRQSAFPILNKIQLRVTHHCCYNCIYGWSQWKHASKLKLTLLNIEFDNKVVFFKYISKQTLYWHDSETKVGFSC